MHCSSNVFYTDVVDCRFVCFTKSFASEKAVSKLSGVVVVVPASSLD